MSWFLLNRNLTLLEPYDWKLSCTVLRGEEGSNALDLPDRPSDLQQRTDGLVTDAFDLFQFAMDKGLTAFLTVE